MISTFDREQTGSQMRPTLIVIDGSGEPREYECAAFGGNAIRLGRKADNNDIIIPEKFVSSRHATIYEDNGRYFYCDENSSNGSYVTTSSRTRQLKETGEIVELSNNSVIRIGSLQDPNRRVVIWFSYMREGERLTRWDLKQERITIGRDSRNDIVLPHPSVSRTHATVLRQGDRFSIVDNRSMNGILLNGEKLNQQSTLCDKDIIQISGFQLIFSGDSIYYKNRLSGIGITARNINKIVGSGKGRKQILRNADVEIKANEFVAIIGGSGAGKSTIMNVLNGFDLNYTGEVFYNNISLKENFQQIKGIIGYVPQEDIIYENLTLRRMLQYTAKLRMPADATKDEIEEHIDEVLQTLDLQEHQNTLIRKLSGGQKKRASIAVELLADPKLFFLDEPTSGLDPGTEKNLMIAMRDLCRQQQRTIVMVTHTTQSLHLCDKVIFMGPGGRVCFAGNVEEAKGFFENDDLTEIYNIIAADPEKWERKFRQRNRRSVTGSGAQADPAKYQRTRVSALKQFATLTQRYTELMTNDRRKLLILLLEPIVIGLLLFVVSGEHIFDVFSVAMNDGDPPKAIAMLAYSDTKSMMFTLSCAAIWIGLFNSIQEICKERSILKREYMANLRLPVYMGSKVGVQAVIGLIQAILLSETFLLLAQHMMKSDRDPQVLFPGSIQTLGGWAVTTEIILTVWLTIIASMALGLIVSAIVKTGDKAMVVAPFLLIVQLLFSGILFELKGISERIADLTVSKWSVDCLCTIANIGNIDSDLHPSQSEKDKGMFIWDPHTLTQDWVVLLVMAAVCIVISTIVLRSVAKDGR